MRLEDYTVWNQRLANQRKGNQGKKWGRENEIARKKRQKSRERLDKLFASGAYY